MPAGSALSVTSMPGDSSISDVSGAVPSRTLGSIGRYDANQGERRQRRPRVAEIPVPFAGERNEQRPDSGDEHRDQRQRPTRASRPSDARLQDPRHDWRVEQTKHDRCHC